MTTHHITGLTSALLLLTGLFTILKLTGCLNWSWPWILSPLWIGLAVALIAAAIVFALLLWSGK